LSVIAYADDVTIFVTKPEDFCIIRDAVRCFEKASGAHLNVRKSKALAVGGWEEAGNDLGVEYHQSIKILDINFSSMIERTMHENWALQKARVKTNAKQVYGRDLCLAQRVRYVHIALLATIWFTAQILPAPVKYTQQLTIAILWFIWQGAAFRVPITTLQKPTTQAGWALLNVASKCRALLLKCMWILSMKEGLVTASWLREWGLVGYPVNPPNVGRISKALAYLIYYALDMAYNEAPKPAETNQQLASRLYSTLQQMARAGR